MFRGTGMKRCIFGALLAAACLHVTIANEDDRQQLPVSGSGGENKFLKYLFNKYGSKGVISFEGLEHLMHSLGLGGLDFTPSHTLDEHRPEGFKTEDLEKLFTNTAVGSPGSGSNEEKVTVSFTTIGDDHETKQEQPKYSTVTTAEVPIATEVTQRHRQREVQHDHGPRQDAIITSSEQIRSFNEVPQTDTSSKKNNTDKVGYLNSDDDDDNASSKWHREIWQEIIFKEIHDPQHRHPRRDDHRKSCLSPMSMVHLILEEPMSTEEVLRKNFNYNLDLSHRRRRSLPHANYHDHDELDHEVAEIIAARIKITPATFKDLCPALLAQIDQRACHQKYRLNDQPHVEKKLFTYAWLYATICVMIISVCGLTGVAMVPLAKSAAYDEILRFLVALAVGTLCGDALMHLLPHALIPHADLDSELETGHSHEHSHSDEPVWLCCCAFLSALFMYTLETVLPLLRSEGSHQHGHSHGRGKIAPASAPEIPQTRRNTNVTDDIELDLQHSTRKELNTMLEKKKSSSKPLSPVAFMVILGDGLHNITDGLAIGAAFAADPVTGMATSLAILCHELPHELGDFALLLQTGVSIRRAMFLNIVSSVLSFIGMLIGLLVTGLHESVVRWIYAGTAGTFLYIALADLVPEMNRDLREPSELDKSVRKLRIIWSQIGGIFLGGMIMLVIALNEDHLRILFE